jgi:hypothetical protein
MLRCAPHNAAAQPLPKADATEERTLEAVGCSGLFAPALRPILALAHHDSLLAPLWRNGSWHLHLVS